MSSVKKIARNSISELKGPHYFSLSLLNSNQYLENSIQSTEKPEPYSKSPYAKKLVKPRSISNLKDMSLCQRSGVMSPPLNTKLQMSFKPKLETDSVLLRLKDKGETKIKKRTVLAQRKSIGSSLYFIDTKVDEIIAEQNQKGISFDILMKCRECLEEIILNDTNYGTLLRKIINVYDSWIKKNQELDTNYNLLKAEFNTFIQKLAEEQEENKKLHKKMQKISKESVELGRAVEERDANCKILQDHLRKITNIKDDEIPKDATSLKALIAENKGYSTFCNKLKKKIKVLSVQEKRLMRLFWVLKQKGYPVEEVYDNLNAKKVKQSLKSNIEETSDFENISVEPAKNVQKPDSIPNLNMNIIEPNFLSDVSGDDNISY